MNLPVAGASAALVAVSTEVAATVGSGSHQIAVAVITAVSTLLAVVIGPVVTNLLRTRRTRSDVAELRREIRRLRARLDEKDGPRDG